MKKSHTKQLLTLVTVFCILLLFSSEITHAKIELPSIFGSNMVLQQKAKVRIWGNATGKNSVTIITSWDNKTYKAKVKDGNWQVNIKTPTAGGPYSIILNDGEELKLENILIGEVWLCSGQSNMAMPVKGNPNQPVLGSKEILQNANQPKIRLFKVTDGISDKPLNDSRGQWNEASAETVADFSAVGYLYAKILHEKLNVPVGIIQSASGSTMIESWMSKESLRPFPDITMIDELNPTRSDKKQPSVVFNAMINPIVGFNIKGVIWYQGEQNSAQPKMYEKLLPAMVKDWRKLWDIGEFPFYYVQIAPYKYSLAGDSVPYLREAQQNAVKEIPHSGMVVSIDVGSSATVHPPDKPTISKRLANWALANDYGFKEVAYLNPEYKSLEIKDNTILLGFKNAEEGLTSYDKELLHFEIAGADKVFYPAHAKITPQGITVTSDRVVKPVAVRYAFKDLVFGNLYSKEGLPVAPFRTDNW